MPIQRSNTVSTVFDILLLLTRLAPSLTFARHLKSRPWPTSQKGYPFTAISALAAIFLFYLRSEFSRIYESKKHRDVMEFFPRPWPSNKAIQRIVSKSGGYFIYASTVTRFTDEEYFEPPERLDQVLNPSNSSDISDSTPFAELDHLYMQILSFCPKSPIPLLKRILGHTVFHSGPRGIGHISSLPPPLARES